MHYLLLLLNASRDVGSLWLRKYIQKENVTFHANGTVSYLEYRRFFFEPTMSSGNESEVVTIPNMLVLVSSSSSSSSSSLSSSTHLLSVGGSQREEHF
ncbi:Scavenger receptor class B member 1 [Liparis tanakae]|uniref:Scavenger receptor class B member 1 n=1 Tax=Liparis tanakae TaxID=230148 RepID=A0A4Z2E316_9TELE|nr:Scavenger receptor class B member 1 [Liparis tanakae]